MTANWPRPRIELVEAAYQRDLRTDDDGRILHDGVDVYREIEQASVNGWLYRTIDENDRVLWLPTAKGDELLFEHAELAEAAAELARQSRLVAVMATSAMVLGVVGLIVVDVMEWPRWMFGPVAVGPVLAILVAVAGYRRSGR